LVDESGYDGSDDELVDDELVDDDSGDEEAFKLVNR